MIDSNFRDAWKEMPKSRHRVFFNDTIIKSKENSIKSKKSGESAKSPINAMHVKEIDSYSFH